jgi:hypothetical protein
MGVSDMYNKRPIINDLAKHMLMIIGVTMLASGKGRLIA